MSTIFSQNYNEMLQQNIRIQNPNEQKEKMLKLNFINQELQRKLQDKDQLILELLNQIQYLEKACKLQDFIAINNLYPQSEAYNDNQREIKYNEINKKMQLAKIHNDLLVQYQKKKSNLKLVKLNMPLRYLERSLQQNSNKISDQDKLISIKKQVEQDYSYRDEQNDQTQNLCIPQQAYQQQTTKKIKKIKTENQSLQKISLDFSNKENVKNIQKSPSQRFETQITRHEYGMELPPETYKHQLLQKIQLQHQFSQQDLTVNKQQLLPHFTRVPAQFLKIVDKEEIEKRINEKFMNQ